MEAEILRPLIEYFYTGQIIISNDNVTDLLAAASQLLLPGLVEACGQFMADFCLNDSNCLRILAIASSQSFAGNLGWLEAEAMRYIQLHFEAIWQRPEFIGGLEAENAIDEDKCPKMDCLQLRLGSVTTSNDLRMAEFISG